MKIKKITEKLKKIFSYENKTGEEVKEMSDAELMEAFVNPPENASSRHLKAIEKEVWKRNLIKK